VRDIVDRGVATVKSSGATSGSSSHVTGAETGAPGFGRML
jgi:hypothetical protein